jgi:hypothetical protein
VESPLPGDRHGGFGERPGERTRSNPGTAPQADSTIEIEVRGVGSCRYQVVLPDEAEMRDVA